MSDDLKLQTPNSDAPSILVVDDAPYMRQIVSRWLTDAGYRCTEAESVDAALDYLQQNEVHLVTLDITMPGRSGMELLAEIRQGWSELEVIMLTAVDETASAIEALTLGAHGYLIKPIEREELLHQVNKALEHQMLLIEKRQYTNTLEQKVREQMSVIRRAHEETIIRLVSASEYRDEETGTHIRRTGLYCELFAEVLGWPASAIENFRMAAPMHDLGKIGIPDAILQKPSRLTAEEFNVMKTHTTIGAGMLEGSESGILQMAHNIALCHHERWDGTGYPHGLAGLAIPEAARILAFADVYDALTHRRVYREAMREDQALAIMEQGRGTHFDPHLFDVFMTLAPRMRRIAEANPDEQVQYSTHTSCFVPDSIDGGCEDLVSALLR